MNPLDRVDTVLRFRMPNIIHWISGKMLGECLPLSTSLQSVMLTQNSMYCGVTTTFVKNQTRDL